MSMGAYNVVGTVIGLKTKPNPHNFNRTTVTKMTIEDSDGSRYHGTRPHSLVDVAVGDKVQFNADISRSGQVKKWWFFHRPRNAVVIS